jgi:hypothetical protein
MAPIPTGHVLLKFRLALDNDQEEMLCTLGAQTTAASASDRIAALNSAMDSWGDNILPLQSTTYRLLGVDGVFGTASGDLPLSSTDPPRTGGDGDQAAWPNTACLIQKVSGLGGRRNRGRMFVPGIQVNQINLNGIFQPTPLTAMQTAATNFLLGIESGSFLDRAVIFHASGDPTPTVIEQLRVDSVVATQRRRLRP